MINQALRLQPVYSDPDKTALDSGSAHPFPLLTGAFLELQWLEGVMYSYDLDVDMSYLLQTLCEF